MKIITITLNPAFDLHYGIKDFRPYKENYVESVLVSAGGKGINISRALLKSGIDNIAYVILGEENAADFVSRLEYEDFDFRKIYCKGRIRENITIHTPGEPETRISLDNFSISDEVLDQLLDELRKLVDENTVLSFSGRIPKGVSVNHVIDFLKALSSLGCLIAVDCNSFSIEELICISPWVIKPNKQEVQLLLGKKVETIEQAVDAAVEIQKKGIKNVIISMGEIGAAAALTDFQYIVKVPAINTVSTIGAGDSMLAGFIGAYAQGFSMEECLKNAAAYGTSACLTEGTNPPRPYDIQRLREQIKVVQI